MIKRNSDSALMTSPDVKPFENNDFKQAHQKPELSKEQLIFQHIKECKFTRDLEIFEQLLSEGVNVNFQDPETGKTFLMLTAEKGYLEYVQELLEHKSNVNLKDKNGRTALFYAIDTPHENVDVVSRLIDWGSDINHEAYDKSTPLLRAVERNYYSIASTLLEKGASVRTSAEGTGKFHKNFLKSGDSLMHIAVRNKNEDMIKLLVKYDAELKKKNKRKLTPLETSKSHEITYLLSELEKNQEDMFHVTIQMPNHNQPSTITEDNNNIIQVVQDLQANEKKGKDNKKGEKNAQRKNKGKQTLDSISENQEEKSASPITKQQNSVGITINEDEQNKSKSGSDKSQPFESNRESFSSDQGSGSKQQFQTQGRKRNISGTSATLNSSFESGPSTGMSTEQSQNPSHSSPNKGNSQKTNFNNPQISNSMQMGPQNQPQTSAGFASSTNQSGTKNNKKTGKGQNKNQNPNMNPAPNFQSNQNQKTMPNQPYNQYAPINAPYANQMRQPNDFQQPNNTNPKGFKNNNKQYIGQHMINIPQMANDIKFNMQADNMQLTVVSPQIYLQSNMQNMGPPIVNVYPPPNGFYQPPTSIDPKRYVVDMNDVKTRENIKQTAEYETLCKETKSQDEKIQKTLNERDSMKQKLEVAKQNENRLLDIIREKELQINNITKKNEEIEARLKNIDSRKGVLVEVQDKSVETIFDEIMNMDNLLNEIKPNQDMRRINSIYQTLHEEIMMFEKAVSKYNQEKKPLFDSLINSIKETVSDAVPGSECFIYGSFATGLCLPWSDIDIVIKIQQPSTHSQDVLQTIANAIQNKKWVDEIKHIKNASVPVLKITCVKQYLSKKVDISILEQRHNGLACVDLVKEYLAQYPTLRPLVLILKQFLYALNLNDTYSGGLSSYGLILMIVFYFQCKEPNATNNIEQQNLGYLLLCFLRQYGFEFDYLTQCWVYPQKKSKGDKGDTIPQIDTFNYMNMMNQNGTYDYKIVILDPLSNTNNVGRSTFHIKEIKNAFMGAWFEAFQPCMCEIHKSVENKDIKKAHKCGHLFQRMLMAYHPNK